ncbi:MAG: LegC family aminotransferase [Aestuariibacter sp.]
MSTTNQLIAFVRDVYHSSDFIPLHAPVFAGNEKSYVADTLESTFVSSVGKYVDEFERKVEDFTGSTKAIATVNGTAALHTALYLAGVKPGDLVITQALTFVATCNALYHMGAKPVFVDVERDTLGLCPAALETYLEDNAELDAEGQCVHKSTRSPIKAVVPMHTFGHPVRLDEVQSVCEKWGVTLVEDTAESLGSFYKGRHTGTFGDFAALSFNGNKIITTGGGGMVLCQEPDAGERARYITTTAKVPHEWEFYHDEPGFNYRLPNLNAALGCAQMETLTQYLSKKRQLAQEYMAFFEKTEYQFVKEPQDCQSNYWLNAVICQDKESSQRLLRITNDNGIMTRPVWKLMHKLPMYAECFRGPLVNSEWLEHRLVNIPSSPPMLRT